VVAGGPRAGKSHLAERLSELTATRRRGTDELVTLGWSEGSEAASHWFDEPGPWIVEGVAMSRALRKWLARNPTGAPADTIVHLNAPAAVRSRGQHVMALGCQTVWEDILPELQARGVHIIDFK
jgi:hypothetical protein